MERLGIICHSSSPWSSPLHMAPKRDGDGGWCPCGDYRRLNNATTPDRHPVPHIQDFSAHLAGKVIFSKVDLVRKYHQVPVHPADVPKMVVITPFGCLLDLKPRPRGSSVLWTLCYMTCLSFPSIWMTSWWQAPLCRSTCPNSRPCSSISAGMG